MQSGEGLSCHKVTTHTLHVPSVRRTEMIVGSEDEEGGSFLPNDPRPSLNQLGGSFHVVTDPHVSQNEAEAQPCPAALLHLPPEHV